MRLEPRDRRILVEAFSSRFVRRNDLIAFGLFHSVPRCNARLLRLKRALLLRPHFHLGGNELRAPFYSCTAKGARIAACELHIAPNEAISIHRARARDQAIQHALRCNDLRARLVADLNADELRLISWAPEILCR